MATCSIINSQQTGVPSLLKFKIPYHSNQKDKKDVSRIILVIDRSGSMSGGPWRQVQSAVKKIHDMHQLLKRDADTEPIIIAYNDKVSLSNLASVAQMRADGSTNFVSVFRQVQETITQIGSNQRIAVIFMTDGCDTCNSPGAIDDAQTKLKSFFKKSAPNSVVHVIGYSKDHDLKMMNVLKSLGQTEGVYRYAEGSTELDEKFQDLFEFADLTAELSLQMSHMSQPIKITGEWIDSDLIEAECWLSIPDCVEQPIKISIGSENYEIHPIMAEKDILFQLKLLSKRATDIQTQEELDQIQSELQSIDMFGTSIKKADRQYLIDVRTELQTRLNTMHTLMADIARGTLNQTAALAKMNDLRYADKFSKTSRQRRMDQRAIRNQSNLKLIDTKLNSLVFDETTAFDQVDLTTFTCCLTLNNCRDMMMDSRDDIMGVGLVVERQEHIVDAPTLISVKDVSVTILSRSACDDALKMKIDIGDAARLHGGFVKSKRLAPTTSTNLNQDQSNIQVSEFTRGVAAEPINAFLPLYICDAHFQRIEVMLEPMLGYLFTLDITGYKDDQLLGLYSILGQMMNDSAPNQSEREELILHEYTRLCQALLPRTRLYLGEGNDLLEKFMCQPTGRSKAHIQNLMTLFGFMYALGTRNVDPSLRYMIVEEIYRRHFAYIFHGTSDNIIEEHLQVLLYGQGEKGNDDPVTTNTIDVTSHVKTKNDRNNDNRFAHYARAVLKKQENNPKIPTEDIHIEYEIPEREISPMNETIRSKMKALLQSFSLKPIENVLRRLNICLIDMSDDNECIFLRSMLVQCLRFYSNESINSAVLDKNFFNVETNHEQILRLAHQTFDANRERLTNNHIEQIRALEVARRMVLTSDMNVYLGRLMIYAPTRGGKIFDTIFSLLVDRSQKTPPLLIDKLIVIFTGRYKEHEEAEKEFNVISHGLAWFPDRSIIQRVKEALGEDGWNKLDRTMSGRACGHVYRLSDIPNRHGYHNSHPNPLLVTVWNP